MMIPNNPGAVPDPIDSRDYNYNKLQRVLGKPTVNWDKGFEIDALKVEDQNGSSSCVGQAWSKYAEALNIVEESGFTDLSAKFIYSQIFMPKGGAYIREGAKIVVNQGISPEKDLSSYPSTEANMRKKEDITKKISNKAIPYKAKSYASIWHKNKINKFAEAILQNHGVVTGVYGEQSGWETAYVSPPTTTNVWGHAIYCVGFFKKNNKKYIKFINSWGTSWGDSGYGYIGEDYFNDNIFSAWTLVDLPNTKTVEINTMTWEQINTLSLLCFKRPADEGMRGYEGKDFDFVAYYFLNSKENQLYTKVFEAIKIIEKDL